MDKKVALVESYCETFRDLINANVLPSNQPIRSVLKLSKDEDWAFLCSAMDIVGDACLAIDNFLKFGLDGPTKYNEFGERYLRLYGILTATYIQQEAVLKLYQLMNVPPSLKNGKDMIEALELRHLRHKLSSHSTNYRDKNTNTIETYIPIRIELNNFNCGYIDNKKIKATRVDLKKAVNQHLETLITMQDMILEKAIKTLFKGQETNKKYKKFAEKQQELRIIRKGGLVIKSSDGTKIIFTSYESNESM